MQVSRSVRSAVVAFCIALPLVLAPPALAEAPDAFVETVDVTGATTATVYSSVYAGGQATSFFIEYGEATSDFCTSLGVSAAGKSITGSVDAGSGLEAVERQTQLSGLTPGIRYCTQVIASNDAGDDTSFGSLFYAGLPEPYLDSAESVAADAVKVTGGVDPNAQATTIRVRYADQQSDWCTSGGTSGASTLSPESVGAGAGNGFVPGSLTVGGLTPGAELCLRAVATNGSGEGVSTQASYVRVGAPSLVDWSEIGTSSSSTRVLARISTAGQDTNARVEYGEATTPWCVDDGLSGSPATTTAPQQIAAASTPQTVTAELTGLDPAKSYCYRWTAQNASAGPLGPSPTSFNAGGPDVTTLPATAISALGATLNATVNPFGSTTFAGFDVSPSSSPFCQSGGLGFADEGTNPGNIGGGMAGVPVSSAYPFLRAATSYCYRGTANNQRAATVGALQSFTTLAAGENPGGDPGATPGGTTDGGTAGGGTTTPASGVAAQTISRAPGPFDTLAVAKLQYDLRMRALSFTAFVGKAGSKVRAVLTLNGRKVADVTRSGGPGAVVVKLTLNAKARKALQRKKLAKFSLTVTVTPPGGAPVTKKATISLKRAKDPCVVTRKSPGSGAHAAC